MNFSRVYLKTINMHFHSAGHKVSGGHQIDQLFLCHSQQLTWAEVTSDGPSVLSSGMEEPSLRYKNVKLRHQNQTYSILQSQYQPSYPQERQFTTQEAEIFTQYSMYIRTIDFTMVFSCPSRVGRGLKHIKGEDMMVISKW